MAGGLTGNDSQVLETILQFLDPLLLIFSDLGLDRLSETSIVLGVCAH